tara:strand:+ start:260 stop:1180 length:921 start_codon:yes stop_codon:yes gene_type:complete
MKLQLSILILYIFIPLNSLIATENKILFKVNNEIITSVDILDEIKYLSSLNTNFESLDENKKYEIVKNSLIKEKVKEIFLKNIFKKIELEDEDFNRVAINTYSRFGIENIDQLNLHLQKFAIKKKILRRKISINSFWNQLIYDKFYQNVKIDLDEIKKDLIKDDKQTEYNLSEIVFNLENNENLDDKFQLIKSEIISSSFKNAALIYSISDTSVSGGNLGWIKQNSISKKILKEILKVQINHPTNPIRIPSGFLILNVNELRETKKEINLDLELEKVVKIKTNDQLNQFSNIFFNKIKKNIIIYEN